MITYLQDVVAHRMKARFEATDRGAALVEYALLLAFIAVLCIAALTFVGDEVTKNFSEVGASLAS